MLISRVAALAPSPSTTVSDVSSLDSSPDENTFWRGSRNQMWSKLQRDIAKAFFAQDFLTRFDCHVFDASEQDWIPSYVLISSDGAAELYHDASDEPFATHRLPQGTVVGHLNKLMVQISDPTQTFLLSCKHSIFPSVCATLFAWSRLRHAGMGNKMWVPPVPELGEPDIDMLRCEVKAHFTVYNRQHSGWTQFVATLKRGGLMQLFDSSSNVIYSLQVRKVLGSRIKTVDSSVVDSSMVLLLFPDLGGPESVYLKFSDIDDFEDWVATLRSLSLQPIAAPLSQDALLSVRWCQEISIKIGSTRENEGVDRPSRSNRLSSRTPYDHGSNVYVAVCLSRWVFARTFACPKVCNANWDQTFHISGPELTSQGAIAPKQLEFKLKHRSCEDSGEEDVTIGTCTITDMPNEASWRWYDLSPSNTSISISISLQELPVLDSSYYQKLYDWTTEIELNLAVRLVSSMPSSLNTLLPIFSDIYRAQGRQVEWVQSLAAEEVKRLDFSCETAFREASLFTKSVESVLQTQGEATLKKTVGRFVRKLITGTEESLELDPSRTSLEKAKANAATMHYFLNYLWSLIQSEGPPSVCRPIFTQMKSELQRMKLPDETIDRLMTKAISSLLFLRFYVPALVNPQLFNLTNMAVEPAHRRTLVLVAKIIQGFANRVKFGTKETWLVSMNSFVEENGPALAEWYANISDQEPEWPVERPSKELPLVSFMGQQITSPNLVDEWATFARLAKVVCLCHASPEISDDLKDSDSIVQQNSDKAITESAVRDPLVREFIKECRGILAKQEELIANLEQADPFEANFSSPPPQLFLNSATLLFGTEKNELKPRKQKANPSMSFPGSGSRLIWLPNSLSSNNVSLNNRTKPSGSMRKLTQMLRISKTSK